MPMTTIPAIRIDKNLIIRKGLPLDVAIHVLDAYLTEENSLRVGRGSVCPVRVRFTDGSVYQAVCHTTEKSIIINGFEVTG